MAISIWLMVWRRRCARHTDCETSWPAVAMRLAVRRLTSILIVPAIAAIALGARTGAEGRVCAARRR